MDGKTFEDLTYEVIKCISPAKISRDLIPFDSVREIVLAELSFGKKDGLDSPDSDGDSKKGTKLKMMPSLKKRIRRKIEYDEMDEGTSSSSSSHFAHTDDGYGGPVSRFTSTDYEEDDFGGVGKPPRSISAKNLGNSMRLSTSSNSSSTIQHTISAPAICSMTTGNDEKRKGMTNRERRMAEIRLARIKTYRDELEIFEFSCEENALESHFDEYYWKMLNDPVVEVASAFYRIVESLDLYFRGRTWDTNCVKLSCEFLGKSVYKTCQQLNEAHDAKDSNDEMRVKELMLQVLIGLHVFTFGSEKPLLDDAIKKLRLIYISADAQRMRTFLEKPVTDIFIEKIAESIATVYDELCIALPADLTQFDTGFKMIDSMEESVLGRRRNGNANKLEQMLAETAVEIGNGSAERKTELRRNVKRKIDLTREHSSPSRKRLVTSGEEKKKEKKRFFVEDTPDDKYHKIKEEIEDTLNEVVQQTPMAKLRMAANKNGRRCSKRLSDLVKLSEDRAQIPKRARENVEKMLEKTKASTPLRSVRRTSKSFLLSNNSPSPLSVTRSSRTSLSTRFSSCSSKPSTSSTTPLSVVGDKKSSLRTTRTCRSNGSIFQNGNSSPIESSPNGKLRIRVKKESYVEEEEEDYFEDEEWSNNGKEVLKKSKNGKEWTDRRLKSKLGLTRDDLNRYREAMLAAGTVKQETENKGDTTRNNQWDNRQVNRAGRVKGSGTVKAEEGTSGSTFGVIKKRKKQNIYICHVLLNESNPDTSFDWSKVNNLFDDFQNKPVTRSVQNLLMKPEKILESYKRKFMESSSSSSSPAVKRSKSTNFTSPKKVSPRKEASVVVNGARRKINKTKQLRVEDYEEDEFGLEPEAD